MSGRLATAPQRTLPTRASATADWQGGMLAFPESYTAGYNAMHAFRQPDDVGVAMLQGSGACPLPKADDNLQGAAASSPVISAVTGSVPASSGPTEQGHLAAYQHEPSDNLDIHPESVADQGVWQDAWPSRNMQAPQPPGVAYWMPGYCTDSPSAAMHKTPLLKAIH